MTLPNLASVEIRIGELQDRPWAMQGFTLFDPSGVPSRVAQNLPQP